MTSGGAELIFSCTGIDSSRTNIGDSVMVIAYKNSNSIF